MLMGEYHHNIDEKGRLVIPNIYRDEIGTKIVVTRGLEKCLYAYSIDDWNKLVAKLETLPFTKKDARTFLRSLFSGATVCEFDKSGRINITSPLASYAGLNAKCVIIGVNDRLEIWDEKIFNSFEEDNMKNIEAISESLYNDITL